MITMKELQECHALAVELITVKMALYRLKCDANALNGGACAPDTNNAYIERKIHAVEQTRTPLISKLDRLLAAVEDIDIYIFMRLHYLCGFYWNEVAVLTGEKSGDAVNTRAYKCCRSIMRNREPSKGARKDESNELSAFYDLTSELAHLMTMRKALCKSMGSCEWLLESSPEIGTVMKFSLQILDERITALKTMRTNKASAVTALINSIVQCTVQTYMRLHCIHGLTWEEVAYFTDAASGAAVRQRVHTHISKAQTIGCRETTVSKRWVESLRTFRERSITRSEQERLLRTLQAHTSDQNAVEIFQQRPLCDIPEELRRLRSEVALLRSEQEMNISEVNALIDSISDAEAQEYMRLFYVQGLSWEGVAMVAHAQSGEAARVRTYQYTCSVATPPSA